MFLLEPVCCKKQQKKSSWPVTGLHNSGLLKDLNDSKLIVYESKWFPWSYRINFIPFRIFRGPLFHKSVTALVFSCWLIFHELEFIQTNMQITVGFTKLIPLESPYFLDKDGIYLWNSIEIQAPVRRFSAYAVFWDNRLSRKLCKWTSDVVLNGQMRVSK